MLNASDGARPSSPDGTRPRNLSRILGLVHASGALSRAALTEATGLNRSTIADLVAELERIGLVHEREPDASGRVGRPSPMVAASPDVIAIAANPEVDALEIAAVGLDRSIRLRERITYDTSPTPESSVELIAERIADWQQHALATTRIVALGVAVPGLVRAADGVVRNAPHLQWRETPLADDLAARTALPVAVENDASLGAIAEQRFGAARGHDHAVYLNGGASGIGGGFIVHGIPVSGVSGYAGEFGHNRVGGSALVLEDEVNRRRLLDATGLSDATDAELAIAITTPDAAAEVARQRGVLAVAIANAVNVLNPSVVILGGFLAALADLDLDGLTGRVRSLAMQPSADDVTVRTAALGEDRLLIGAAEHAFAALLQNPTG